MSGAKGTKKFEEKHKLKGPWIQQLTLGLKNFILSTDDDEFVFKMIRPDTGDMVEVKAKKKEKTDNLIKVDISPTNFALAAYISVEAHFNLKTGDMMRMTQREGVSSTTIERQ